jgi:hypothetical protein
MTAHKNITVNTIDIDGTASCSNVTTKALQTIATSHTTMPAQHSQMTE